MNPYQRDLGDRDAVAALAENVERIRRLVGGMRDDDFERAYGSGKWTATQILDHLAQTEMVFGLRLRMALTVPNYVVQVFDQDKFMAREPKRSGRQAFEAYYALRRFNLPLYASLSPEERQRVFTHPERGPMNAGDLVAMIAGHELHHMPHLEQIAAGR
jgi:uncharacterized damage-inducible protein DinB